MSINFLKYAKSINNSMLCKHDSTIGYSTNWAVNGDVDGWDLYDNVYFYGCWNGVLFGSSFEKECSIYRSNAFVPLAAEYFYIIKVMLRITPKAGKKAPTKGKIRWITVTDDVWDTNKEKYFDLFEDDVWHLYQINLGPEKWYQGDIVNLRFFPFIDGHLECKFSLKYVYIESNSTFNCLNTQCNKYTKYTHPCPWTGSFGYVESFERKEFYTTISGESDSLILNINNYGSEVIELGTNNEASGNEIAAIIAQKINQVALGGYTYASVEYTVFGKLKIIGGDIGSIVTLEGGTASEELGFFVNNTFIGTKEAGVIPATGFNYASSRRLTSIEIQRLLTDNGEVAYFHNPKQYSVEAGRSDYNLYLTSNGIDREGIISYFINFSNVNNTVIDVSHVFNDSGLITDIFINCGKIRTGAELLIVRPHKNGDYSVIYTFSLDVEDPAYIYTVEHTSHRIQCNCLVSKGDTIAIYNADPVVGLRHYDKAVDARYFIFTGKASGRFYPGNPHGTGITGFSWYARSSQRQSSVLLDIDLGERVALKDLEIKGIEQTEYFEYNIAACKDLLWQVDLHNGTHTHEVGSCINSSYLVETHSNIAYGIPALNDAVTTPDGGKQGDSYTRDSSGIVTIGQHAYFYVNGDAEWGYSVTCDGKHEFCYPWCNHVMYGFTYDPISFILYFPAGISETVYKTSMYFKEHDNFRHFSLSYFYGEERSQATGVIQNFYYVPKYNSVTLDGSTLTYEDSISTDVNGNLRDFFFSNPTPWLKVNYTNTDVLAKTWSIKQTMGSIYWNVLEHDFDDIRCNGFKIFTSHHNSTKLSEIELYSRYIVTPSLTDNVFLKVSEDAVYWRSISFSQDATDSSIVSASIDSSPRYISLELSSQTEFSVFNINTSILNTQTLKNCIDQITLNTAPIKSYSEVKEVVLKNRFNNIANLEIIIDKSIDFSKNLISYVKFDSFESLNRPIEGPGVKLYKNSDYLIKLNKGQVAINSPVYGLRNLIDGKKAYVLENNFNIWNNYTTLEAGNVINYSSGVNLVYTSASFNSISTKEFLINLNTGKGAPINESVYFYTLQEFTPWFNNILFSDYEIYLQADVFLNTNGYKYVLDESNSLDNILVFYDNFSDNNYLDKWIFNNVHNDDFSAVLEDSGKLYLDSLYINQSFDIELSLYKNFESILSFYIQFKLVVGDFFSEYTSKILIDFIGLDGNYFYQCEFSSNKFYLRDFNNNLRFNGVSLDTVTGSLITLERTCNSTIFIIKNLTTQVETKVSLTSDFVKRLAAVKIRFINPVNALPFFNMRKVYFENFYIYTKPVLSQYEAVRIVLKNSELLDTFKIVHNDSLTSLNVYIKDLNNNLILYSSNNTDSNTLNVYQTKGDAFKSKYNPSYSSTLHKRLLIDDNYFAASGELPNWVGYDFGETPMCVNKIGIAQVTARNCQVLELHGSNDLNSDWEDKNWVLLHSFNSTVVGLSLEYVTFTQSATFRFYRLYAPDVEGNTTLWWIYTWRLYKVFEVVPHELLLVTNAVQYSFCIDLSKRHSIDLIRNFGNLSNKMSLGINYPNVSYSNSETSEIAQVDWSTGYTVCLLHFEENFSESIKDYSEYNTLDSFYVEEDFYNYVFGKQAGYFNGTNSYISMVDTGHMYFSVKDFTIDCRVFIKEYPTYGNYKVIFSKDTATTHSEKGLSLGIDFDGGLYISYLVEDNLASNFNLFKLNKNVWYHLALIRHSFYLYLAVDGIVVYSWTKTNKVYTNYEPFIIGAQNNGTTRSSFFCGSIDEFRIVIGKAIWTSNFEVPVMPYSSGLASINDVRWIRFDLDCSSATPLVIDTLSIHPNIANVYCKGGGYNCEWDALGSSVTNYLQGYYNVASQYTAISGTSSYPGCPPDNVVKGLTDDYTFENCWGFLASDTLPTLYIELQTNWEISEFILYHGTGLSDDGYINTSFKIYVAQEPEEYTEVVSVTGNTSYSTTHTITPVVVRYIKLEIISYTSGNKSFPSFDEDGLISTKLFDGGFLREMEVYVTNTLSSIYSSQYPIICLNLQGQYNVSSINLFCSNETNKRWDSDADKGRIKYSDFIEGDPKFISFSKSQEASLMFYEDYEVLSSYLDSYVYVEDLFLYKGSYTIIIDYYNATTLDRIVLEFEKGATIIKVQPNLIGAGWITNTVTISIVEEGYYRITLKEDKETDDQTYWGARNFYIKRLLNLIQWVSINMPATIGYEYDTYTAYDKELKRVWVLTADSLTPTTNKHWWISELSTLQLDYINTINDACSLDIYYPTSSGLSSVAFIEGDNFGIDTLWHEKDLLSFWLYIDDISNLDLSVGGVGFGNINGNTYDVYAPVSSPPVVYKQRTTLCAYGWDFSKMNLSSGWNKVKLKFSDWSITNPLVDPTDYGVMPLALNLKNYATSSFGLFFSGVGAPLNMKLCDLRIQRNVFEDKVKDTNGLCISWNEFVEVPVSGLNLQRGTVEMMLKLYTDSTGRDIFGNVESRVLFSLTTCSNDILVFGIRSSNWFEVSLGNSLKTYVGVKFTSTMDMPAYSYIAYDEPVHLAVCWSNDGHSFDNRDTLRIYLNGNLVARYSDTWQLSDYKVPMLIIGGGNCPAAYNLDSSGSAIFEWLKVYDYCKTEFDINNPDKETLTLTSNDYIYISKDNVNFYSRFDKNLPLKYEGVAPDEEVSLYIKYYKDRFFKNLNKLTGEVLIDWHVPV